MYKPMRNGGGFPKPYEHQRRPPFDAYLVEDFFPKVSPAIELDNVLNQAILKRNAELMPTTEEQTDLVNLASKVQMVLETLSLTPGTFDACQIEEIRQVGSFKKGTMLTKRGTGNPLVADIVVVLRTLPVVDAIVSLGSRTQDDLIKIDQSVPSSDLKLTVVDGRFEITNISKNASVRVLIATVTQNLRKIDNSVHLHAKLLQRHMSAIRHVRWFDESANLTTIKVLIRVLRDMSNRYKGFGHLSPWMIDVLAHYAVTFRNSQQLLPLGSAFKRVLQLLAGGLFLPGSSSIPDPCENGAHTIHSPLSLVQQDEVCMTAQTLLRVLVHSNGHKVILGLEPDALEQVGGITGNTSVWDNVVVVPSTAAFEITPRDSSEVESSPQTAHDAQTGDDYNATESAPSKGDIPDNRTTDE